MYIEERLYVCEICGFRFVEKGILKCYLLVYINEKFYVCDECDKVFRFFSYLKRYKMWVYKGVKRIRNRFNLIYICDVCLKDFYDKNDFIRYKRIYIKEKFY